MLNTIQYNNLKENFIRQRLNTLCILEDYENNAHTIPLRFEYTKLNPQQHFLFKRVLHGLKMYKKEEIDSMHNAKRKRIIKVWKRGQDTINFMKQRICNRKANTIFSIFTHSSFAKELLENYPDTDYEPTYINKLNLKDLNIKYEDLIIKFISVGLLPKNFFDIK